MRQPILPHHPPQTVPAMARQTTPRPPRERTPATTPPPARGAGIPPTAAPATEKATKSPVLKIRAAPEGLPQNPTETAVPRQTPAALIPTHG